ncbi:MAG: hypothetical protein V7644_756 [Actinomycetota bacterium]
MRVFADEEEPGAALAEAGLRLERWLDSSPVGPKNSTCANPASRRRSRSSTGMNIGIEYGVSRTPPFRTITRCVSIRLVSGCHT